MSEQTLAQRVTRAARDPSLIAGGVIVFILILVAAIGPEIAPHNPYMQERIQLIDGEIVRAPIAPNQLYPLGTNPQGGDQVSWLLYGTRTTIIIALVATMIRLILGVLFGSLAGWWPGSWIDKLVSAAIDFLASVPALILAMLLVYGIGIRTGQVAFVLAISVAGFGEVAQIFRSHVLSLRNEEFVDSARAIGLTSLGILSRHILPNLTSTIITLAALEMGSALLLLGELGFVRVFIGGGGIIAGDFGAPAQLIAEIPEWGAMLGTTWRYFRALPWLPGTPALAFFIAILGFNLFGFGLQRFMIRGRFYPSGLSVLRVLLLAGLVLFGSQALLANTGPEMAYKEQAAQYDVSRTWVDIDFMTDSRLEGRYPGSGGRDLAASYIAQQFSAADLTPLMTGSYFQMFSELHGNISQDPVLEILAGDEVVMRIDTGLSYSPWALFSLPPGTSEFTISFRGNPRNNATARNPAGLFISDGAGSDPVRIRIIPDQWISDMIQAPPFSAPQTFLEDIPFVLLGETQATSLFEYLGQDYEDIANRVWEQNEVVRFDTEVQARLHYGLEYQAVPGINVIGYMPGTDIRVQTQRILVAAQYTGHSPKNGDYFPGADENASGVATMLEIIRLWRDEGFQPDRTVVFAAFDEVGGKYFAQNPPIAGSDDSAWTVVIIGAVGAGSERLARVDSGGGLETMFDQAIRKMGARSEPLEYYPLFFENSPFSAYEINVQGSYTGLAVTRLGDDLSGTPDDALDHLDPELLDEAGEALAYFLMVLASK